MVLFHGGGWFSGRPRDVEHWVDYLRPKARVINLVEYNVFSVHGQDIDHSFNDCRDALVFLQDDRNTVSKVTETIAFGFSAGGACLLYAALSAGNTNLTSMVLVSPVTDLSASGFKAALIPQAGRSDLSPLHLLEQNPGKLGFRCIVLHGTRDTTVSIDQSRSFVEAWHRTQPGPAILIALDEAQHGFHKSSTGFARTRAELNVALFSNSSELVKGPINSG